MPRALVTGATGMVGRYVVERLQRDGFAIRALVRDANRAGALEASGVELVTGDTLNAERFQYAASGCDVLVHAAAAITPTGGWDAFRRPNVEGTRNAIEAAASAGARLVHISSVAVYGSSARYQDGNIRTDEDTNLSALDNAAFYARSKRESEEMVLAAHRSGRVWATAVRPDVIYGRYDRQFIPRMAKILRYGVMPVVAGGHTTVPVVHAENVADGIARAVATDAAGGRAYNLANDFDVTVSQFFALGASGLGITLRQPSIPFPIARVAIGAMRAIGPVFLGSQFNVVTAASLDFLTKDNPFSSERARRELGWNPPVRPEFGIPDAFRWAVERRRAGLPPHQPE